MSVLSLSSPSLSVSRHDSRQFNLTVVEFVVPLKDSLAVDNGGDEDDTFLSSADLDILQSSSVVVVFVVEDGNADEQEDVQSCSHFDIICLLNRRSRRMLLLSSSSLMNEGDWFSLMFLSVSKPCLWRNHSQWIRKEGFWLNLTQTYKRATQKTSFTTDDDNLSYRVYKGDNLPFIGDDWTIDDDVDKKKTHTIKYPMGKRWWFKDGVVTDIRISLEGKWKRRKVDALVSDSQIVREIRLTRGRMSDFFDCESCLISLSQPQLQTVLPFFTTPVKNSE